MEGRISQNAKRLMGRMAFVTHNSLLYVASVLKGTGYLVSRLNRVIIEHLVSYKK